MTTRKRRETLAELTPAQKRQLEDIEAHAITEFEGQLPDLEAALGMLRLGHHLGWKVLYVIHSKKTIRKYEQILGEDFRIREVFPEVGPGSYRSLGLRVVQTLSNFWKAISGERPIPDRQRIIR
jgi:hypothetical protein